MRLAFLLVAVTAVSTAFVGCDADVDRASYVARNTAALEQVPSYPGARLVRVSSTPYKDAPELLQDIAPVSGYRTLRISEPSQGTTPEAVVRFYRRELRRDGWRQIDAARRHLSMRNGDAYLHVLVRSNRLTLWLDHGCFEGNCGPRR